MSLLEFIASVVSSLAWPTAVLVAIVAFRGSIRRFLNTPGPLRRLKMPGGFEAIFELQAEDTKVALESEGVLADEAEVAPVAELTGLNAVAARSPRGAIVEAATKIESRLIALLDESAVEIGPNRSLGTMASVAHKAGVISESQLTAIIGLHAMRNIAVHGRTEELTTAQAVEYLGLADAVLRSLGRTHG